MSRGRTNPLPVNPTDKWERCSDRLGFLLPSASALLTDWGFLWTVKAVLAGPERPFPGGAYAKNAARHLLTPLYISCVLRVWILLFDDSGERISVSRIARAVRREKDKEFADLVCSKARIDLKTGPFEKMLSELTDCTHSLKEFETRFSADRHSFAAHALERTSKNDLVDLALLAKVVPKTIYLVELLVALFSLHPMHFDKILNTHCLTAATLFGLREVAEAPKRIFEKRRLPFAKFESAVAAILQANK